MQPVMANSRISIDETLRETARHGSAAFPFQYYLEDVYDFDLHSIDWHWHPEVEFVCLRSGTVQCFAGGERRELTKGFGMFVNSRVVHRFEATASAVMPNMVFSPALLAPEDSLVYRQYVQPLLALAPPCQLLDPGVGWQGEALARMNAVFALWEGESPSPLLTLRLLLELWQLLFDNLRLSPDAPEGAAASGNQARLQVMMQYIHERYAEPLSLSDIAASVYVSKSSALQIFQSGIRQSPVAYLIQYRLKRAALLLGATEKSVSAIAEETGFQSAGYFCRKFRELFRTTPNGYRRMKRG